MGSALILLCGCLSAHTAGAVVAVSSCTGERTYQGIAKRTIGPRAAKMVRLLLIAFAFGTGVAGLSIFADVAQSASPAWRRPVCVALAGCIVTPLVVGIREIERLAAISVAASALVLAFLIYVIFGYVHMPAAEEARLPEEPRTLAGVLHATSVVNLSFNCHFNRLPLFFALPAHSTNLSSSPREANRQQLLRMRRLVGTAVAIALAVYSLVGLLGFYAFHGRPSGNIFADYATLGPVGAAVNYALALAQLLTLPLLVHEGVREAVDFASGRASRATFGGDGGQEEAALLDERAAEKSVIASSAVGLFGGAWCVLMTLTAMVLVDTTEVLGLVSSLCGAPMMNVLPLWMLLKTGSGRTLDVLLLAIGVVATVGFTFSAFRGSVQ